MSGQFAARTKAPRRNVDVTTERSVKKDKARKPFGVQAKLVVGSTNDPMEREADEMAAEVAQILRKGDDSTTTVTPSFQETGVSRIARRATVGAAGGSVDSDTERDIETARSGGKPLDSKIRRRMEGAFGADFGDVRLHVGDQSDQLNDKISARAFTTGPDVFVRRQDYAPGTDAGDTLLAHELAHTIQQGGSTISRKYRDEGAEAEVEEEEEVEEETEEGVEEAEAEVEEEEEVEEEGEEAEEITFSIPAIEETELPVGKGPLMEDGSGTRTKKKADGNVATRKRSSGGSSGTWAPQITVGSSTRQTDDVDALRGADDKFSAKLTPSATTQGGLTTDPYGAMQPEYSMNGIKTTWKKNKIYLEANLTASYTWGTNGGPVKDVASADSPLVTKDTYAQVVSDLTPKLIEKSWRAPRQVYWSQAICERHEKYHAADATKWFLSKGKGVVTKYLAKHPVELTEAEQKDASAIQTKTIAVLTEARDEVSTAAFNYYTGGETSYLSFAGEKRAFGDGKKPYIELAKAVGKRGKKLEADAKLAAEAVKPEEKVTDVPNDADDGS